jgi:hypothetical protein
LSIFTIGKKYKGREISEIPSDDLQWFQEQPWFEDRFPDIASEVADVMSERDRADAHWSRWEEGMNMNDALYGDKWDKW